MRQMLSKLLHEVRLFFTALQFFSRVPVPRWVGYEPAWLQQCARHYPAVGLCMGGASALALWAALQLWPASVAVGLSMAASIWLTGGFHEDGWADTCDGLGGAVSRERALVIMKDSRLGSYGALGLFLMLGLKAASLLGLAELDPLLALAATVWAHTASRAAPVWLLRSMVYAGDLEHAKVKPMAMQASRGGFLAALAWVLGLSALLLCWQAAWLWPLAAASAAAVLATLYMRAWLQRRLGGYTGDNLGATQQVVELAALLGILAVRHAG